MSGDLDLDLERGLVDLGRHLDVPAGEALAARVLAAIDRPVPLARPRARRRWSVVVAAVLALVGVGAAAPALADWLGLPGVRLRDERPSGPPAGTELDLGDLTTLPDATDVVGFAPLVPTSLGAPDAVWVERRSIAPIVSLVYDDEGILVSQFEASLAADAVVEKFTGGATTVERFAIGGARAVWIEGVHEVGVLTAAGYRVDELRLADRVLLLERGERTVRIETTGDRASAEAVARSLR